jgi:EmrB/QacA subfamily drug resistance transporter
VAPASPVIVIDDDPPVDQRSLWLMGGIISIATVAVLLAMTTPGVAVVDLQRVFRAPLTDVQWILSAYLLGLATTIPMSGWASDRFGARNVFLLSLALFIAATALCGLAWNVQSETVFRVLEGLAGGMVMPIGTAIMMNLARPHQRGQVLSLMGVPMMIAPALGPPLGGIVLQSFGWQALFWVSLPVGLAALVLGWRSLDGAHSGQPDRLDLAGCLLVTPGVALLIYGLTQGSQVGWGSLSALGPLGLAAALLAGFTVRALGQTRPLLDLRLFTRGPYLVGSLVMIFMIMSLLGTSFLVPLFLQRADHMNVLESGLVLGSQGLAAALTMPAGGWLSSRWGARPVVLFGIFCIVLSPLAMAFLDASSGPWVWVVALAVGGVGIGCALMPTFTTFFDGLRPAEVSRATAMAVTLQQIASSLGIAVMASIFSARLLAAGSVPGRSVVDSLAHAFDDTMWSATAVGLLALPAALLIGRARQGFKTGRPIAITAVGTATFVLLATYFLAIAFGVLGAPAI